MNFQEFLAPIQDFFYATFDVLEALGSNFNLVLMSAFSLALVYWIVKLFVFQKDEVINR